MSATEHGSSAELAIEVGHFLLDCITECMHCSLVAISHDMTLYSSSVLRCVNAESIAGLA